MTDIAADLAERFRSEQLIPEEKVRKIAYKILGEDDAVAAAARAWLSTGEMPAQPVVEGLSPDLLVKTYLPTQVFTILRTLLKDSQAKSRLRRFPTREFLERQALSDRVMRP